MESKSIGDINTLETLLNLEADRLYFVTDTDEIWDDEDAMNEYYAEENGLLDDDRSDYQYEYAISITGEEILKKELKFNFEERESLLAQNKQLTEDIKRLIKGE